VLWNGEALRAGPSTCELAFTPTDDDDARPVRVEAKGGQFVARLPGPGTYGVILLSVDGVEPQGVCRLRSVSVPSRDELLIPVPRPARPVLRLVDRATGKALPGARVVACPPEDFPLNALGEEFDLPPAGVMGSKGRPTDVQGRVRLPRLVGKSVWYACAEGHAWKAIWVSHAQTGVRTVPLSLGGAMQIGVQGHAPGRRCAVMLTLDGQTTAATRDGEKGPWMAVGLPPGSYRIVVQDADGGARLGEGSGRVRVAAVTKVRIVASLAPDVISSTILVTGCGAWSSKLERLSLQGADDATRAVSRLVPLVAGRNGREYTGDLVDLPAGRYDVSVYPLLWCSQILIGGKEGVRLELPAPRTIVLRVVDADSKRQITAALILQEPCLHPGSPVMIPYDSNAHAFVHQFAPGRATLVVGARRYGLIKKVIEVDDSPRELMVLLHRR
jgi:hypothetical protein